MQLTRFSDYALRVMMYLAAQPERTARVASIAQAYGISAGHLSKVVQRLAHEGFVTTRRGRGGGIVLGREATAVTLGEIVRVTETGAPLVECFDPEHDTCPVTAACGLRHALRSAEGAFFAELDRFTLADVVREPEPFVRLLLRPPARGRRSRAA